MIKMLLVTGVVDICTRWMMKRECEICGKELYRKLFPLIRPKCATVLFMGAFVDRGATRAVVTEAHWPLTPLIVSFLPSSSCCCSCSCRGGGRGGGGNSGFLSFPPSSARS